MELHRCHSFAVVESQNRHGRSTAYRFSRPLADTPGLILDFRSSRTSPCAGIRRRSGVVTVLVPGSSSLPSTQESHDLVAVFGTPPPPHPRRAKNYSPLLHGC
ncbi:hypothetical protein FM103_01555 [Corynebacterium xerosis]|nr:hypothetical protein FM103_01555 [Corynebacterium xerosis]